MSTPTRIHLFVHGSPRDTAAYVEQLNLLRSGFATGPVRAVPGVTDADGHSPGGEHVRIVYDSDRSHDSQERTAARLATHEGSPVVVAQTLTGIPVDEGYSISDVHARGETVRTVMLTADDFMASWGEDFDEADAIQSLLVACEDARFACLDDMREADRPRPGF